ncbi:hypothetical protein PTTG_06944 [Puccinia triticina 1-1 BBBD Race 1]|uniref:DUF1764 domain-containing protein n=2 Tax=Puccinia triticina TaxID=208348 RepID=A0A180GR15_PUCT1|nr:uncharacterized protein PtA15_14A61 [Puccinia triticina]OAV94964.1 hypothetical protein PTTG_06944 [Puccinia triticina 1-1 BBBD Race 1]WAQ91180.1 hypothetical protein PtA15_14A61 [Puccinia triticina]WAR61980.1 hypothetical protein PtB15_14B73 [Puccinia triticina]
MVRKSLSEIDTIFASRGSSTISKKANTRRPDSPGPSSEGAERTTASGRGGSGVSDGKVQGSGAERRPAGRPGAKRKAEEAEPRPSPVEVLIDPSQSLLLPTPNLPPAGSSKKKRNTRALPAHLDLDDEQERAFRDSRGTRAKTEDGLVIYSVEELKIGLGQDTPDCPFDCQCCF